jgi:hypothetical protein
MCGSSEGAIHTLNNGYGKRVFAPCGNKPKAGCEAWCGRGLFGAQTVPDAKLIGNAAIDQEPP